MGARHRNALERTLRLVAVAAAVIALATCGSDDPAAPGDDNPPAGTIGPAGGTVSDGSGASINVPPGALAQEVAITVSGYGGPGDLPTGAVPALELLGGADCGPDGTVFATPVTVTIPAMEPMTPGDQVPLHV